MGNKTYFGSAGRDHSAGGSGGAALHLRWAAGHDDLCGAEGSRGLLRSCWGSRSCLNLELPIANLVDGLHSSQGRARREGGEGE